MQALVNLTIAILLISLLSRSIRFQSGNADKHDIAYLIVVSTIMVLMGGFRNYSVGTDTYPYYRIFLNLGSRSLKDPVSSNASGFPAYRLLCKIVYRCFDQNYRVLVFLTALITIVGVMVFIRCFSCNCQMSVILFLLYYCLFNSWNGARQYLAISMALLAIVFWEKNRVILCVACMATAILTHSATAVLLVYFVLRRMDLNMRRIISIWLIAVMVLVFSRITVPYVVRFFPRFQALYLGDFLRGNMLQFGGISSGRKSLVSVFFFLVALFAFMLRKKSISSWTEHVRTWKGPNASVENIYMMFILMAGLEMIMGLVMRHNSMMQRVQWCLSPFVYAIIPSLIDQTRLGPRLKGLCCVGISLVMIIPYCIQINGNYGGIIPYSFL